MTLSELASYVCAKVRQTDDTAVAKCKQFLAQRCAMIWQDQLWKDSLLEATTTLGTDGSSTLANTVWIPSRGTLLLPPELDRVLAVRTSDRALVAQAIMSYYRQDPDSLTTTGPTREFQLLQPVVWEFETASTIRLGGTAESTYSLLYTEDGTTQIKATGTVDDDFASVLTVLKCGVSGASGTLSEVQSGSSAITISGAGTTSLNGDYTTSSLSSGRPLYRLTGGTTEIIIWVGSQWWIVPVGGTAAYISNDNVATPDLVTTWELSLGGAEPLPTVARTAVELCNTSANAFPTRQRIRLTELPSDSLTLRILAKAKFPGLTDDNDSPPIQGVDNVLIAFAHADMLQRERQYAKAQVLQAEGQALLGQLIAVETVQQAHRPRLIPAEGYGDDWFPPDVRSPLIY